MIQILHFFFFVTQCEVTAETFSNEREVAILLEMLNYSKSQIILLTS